MSARFSIHPARPRGSRVAAALVAGATAVALSLGLAPGGSQQAAAEPQRSEVATTAARSTVSWQPCRNGFECATVRVPLDHDRPRGATISLALLRLPAASPSRRIGSLFLNPGGPGGPGVDFARGVARTFPLDVRARFDIVGFDPRGIGRSTPLRCYPTLDQALKDRPPFVFPVTAAEERVQEASDRRLAAACARNGGAILNHMSTADVARDLDLLRAAVGDSKLNFLGGSYGSVIGQTYANLFPQRVRAVVIDGVLDPVAWATGRGKRGHELPVGARLGSDIGAQATLSEFFRLCDKSGRDCALSGGANKRFAALAAQARRKPIDIVDPSTGQTFPLTYDLLIGITLSVLYDASIWPDAAAFFADAAKAAGPKELGRQFAALRADTAATEPYLNIIEGYPGVLCADSTNPKKLSAWQRAADRNERSNGYFGRLWAWSGSQCLSWPATARQDRYAGPWTARTAKPVLVIGNRFDPATPYAGAVAASRLLPNSRLLTYAGWGHTAGQLGNYCINRAVATYLVTTRTPRRGKVCQPEGSPFGSLEPNASRVPVPSLVGPAGLR